MLVKTLKVSAIKVDREERQRFAVKDVEDLKLSLASVGLIHPIVVDKSGRLIAGERRLTAAKELGWKEVPVRMWEELSPVEAQIVELEENIKRQDISWQENCEAVIKIHRLYSKRDKKWTKKKTAAAVGVSDSHLQKILTVAQAVEEDPKLGKASSFVTAHNLKVRRQKRAVEAEVDLVNLNPSGKPEVKKKVNKSFSIKHADFIKFASTYKDAPFNFIHCDFPYGIDLHTSKQMNTKMHGEYPDTKKTYLDLLAALAKAQDNVISSSAHLMFWFSMNHYTETIKFFEEHTDFVIQPHPLVWLKSDGRGLVPDPARAPRRVYETALLGARGDRRIISAVNNAYAAPQSKHLAEHTSEKPESVLRFFFKMLVDDTTRLLDPTCGAGSAVRAAKALHANNALGIEYDKHYADTAKELLETTHWNAVTRKWDGGEE